MERGSFEGWPGTDHEREILSGEYEPSAEREKSPEELLYEAFENGSRFDDEDEKARHYNDLLDKADEQKAQLEEVSESINQATATLASLPLTGEQQILLARLEQLMAERKNAILPTDQKRLDERIEATVKELATLPVTDEQGEVLDMILKLIDEREVLEASLSALFKQNSRQK